MATRKRASLKSGMVLIVDSGAAARLTLVRLLEGDGWNAQGMGTIGRVLEALHKGARPRAILLNWDMGDTSIIFAARVRMLLGCQTPAILAFANNWGAQDLRRALQIGVDGLLTGPVQAQHVREELESLDSSGLTKSRARLLIRMGKALLEPVPDLFELRQEAKDDDDWRRLVTVHDRKPIAQEMAEFASLIRPWLMEAHGLEDTGQDFPDEYLAMLYGPFLAVNQDMDGDGLKHLHGEGNLAPTAHDALRKRMDSWSRYDWKRVVDRVRLVPLRAEFKPELENLGLQIDFEQVKREMGEAEATRGLDAEEETRLRVLAAMMRQTEDDQAHEVMLGKFMKAKDELHAAVTLSKRIKKQEQASGIRALRVRMGLPPETVAAKEISVLIDAGHHDAAYFAISEMDAGDPRAIPLLAELDEALRQSGQLDEVEKFYERLAAEAERPSVALMVRHAQLKLEKGQPDLAMDILVKAERIEPGSDEIRMLRDEVLAQMTVQQ